MSSVVDEMKSAADEVREYRKMDDLIIDVVYPVEEFFLKETKYGPCLTGLVKDPESERRFNVFFPSRFTKVINNENKLEELNAAKLGISYKGRNISNSNSIILDIVSE
ncbi:hypothetical protein ACFFRR_006125 [Megaselia abdita]